MSVFIIYCLDKDDETMESFISFADTEQEALKSFYDSPNVTHNYGSTTVNGVPYAIHVEAKHTDEFL